MPNFTIHHDDATGEKYLATHLCGKNLLTLPQINKGTAFSEEERWAFDLKGKLPFALESIEQQMARAYKQYLRFQSNLERNIYLKNLQSINETLFYRLVSEHLEEMLPIVYTPTVAESVETYSQEYRRERGLYIAYPDRYRIPELLKQRTNPEIDLIVTSDAEGVLGIGDQGVGGMDIPIAKLMVYTLCGGISPWRVLPIYLDCGTNNQALLNDPMYLGWRHERVRGEAYDEMIDLFVDAVKEAFPGLFLHWEDFGRDNARRNLERFKDSLCTFNDDMQGTGAVVVSALLAAAKVRGVPFHEQRIVIFGAGTAGVGIADQICEAIQRTGNLSVEEARQKFWLIDRQGLLVEDMDNLASFQKPYARKKAEVDAWQNGELAEVIRRVQPTTLIGSSTKAGAFTEDILRQMAAHVAKPIIFPLSNPTQLCEAKPADILKATDGQALIATGSPFTPVEFQNHVYAIAQCNNALIFPGIGLAVVAVKAKRLTDNMLWAACRALAQASPALVDERQPLLPPISHARVVSQVIAKAVALQAIEDKVADVSVSDVDAAIEKVLWEPRYLPYRRVHKGR